MKTEQPIRADAPTVWEKWLPLFVPAGLLVIWFVASAFWFPSYVLPSPLLTLQTLVDFVSGFGPVNTPYSGEFLEHVGASLFRVATGYVIACALGVIGGVALGASSLARRAFDGIVNSIRSISVTAWLPLAIVWFGLGTVPAVFLIVLGVVFPVLLNTMESVRDAPQGLIRAARMLGSSRSRTFFTVRLPSAMPGVMVGMRIGLSLAWALVVVAEMAGAQNGIGWVLMDARVLLLPHVVIAGMIVLGVLGYLSDRAMQSLSNYLLRWNPDR